MTTPFDTSSVKRIPVRSRTARRLDQLSTFMKESQTCGVHLHETHGRAQKAYFVKDRLRPETSPDGSGSSEGEPMYIPGLCRILADVFFSASAQEETGSSSGRHRGAGKSGPSSKSDIQPKHVAGAEFNGQLASDCHATGKHHGTLVHNEVQTLITRYLRNARFNEPMITADEYREFQWDPCTVRVLDYLVHKQYWPVITELVVHDSLLGIATAIDITAVDCERNETIFIELKTTMNKGFDDAAAPRGALMKSYPLLEVPDTPLNRAYVQSICTKMLGQRMGSGFTPERFVVLLVSPLLPTLKEYPMPAWYSANPSAVEDGILAALQQHQQEKQSLMASAIPKSEIPRELRRKRRRRSKHEHRDRKGHSSKRRRTRTEDAEPEAPGSQEEDEEP